MSQVKISGNASGTGTLTIAAPNTNTDRTINIPDTAGNIVTTGDSGTITAPMLDGGQTGSAPAFAARAWVNFNGTGTISITASGNVSSLTDNGTGNYTINFTTAMPDANYCAVASGDPASVQTRNILHGVSTLATGSYVYEIETSDGDAIDQNPCLSLVVR
tara:strand:- start:118 stop:600 length:483 start_codon:yes stop_codon:yes gene_type:complete